MVREGGVQYGKREEEGLTMSKLIHDKGKWNDYKSLIRASIKHITWTTGGRSCVLGNAELQKHN